jgi:hypothetical protein
MRRAIPSSLLAFTTMLLLTGSALADSDAYKSVLSPERDGLTMGASFGRGSIEVDCDTCDTAKLTEALSLAAHIGYMVTPRIAVVGEHWTVRYNERGGPLFDDSERHLVAQHMSTSAAQLFVTHRLWLKAGVGVGWHITDGDYDKEMPISGPVAASATGGSRMPESSDSVAMGNATFAAVGYEFAHNTVFAADIQFRVGSTQRPDKRYQILNTGLNIGFNWY